jgi:hypothetical protein
MRWWNHRLIRLEDDWFPITVFDGGNTADTKSYRLWWASIATTPARANDPRENCFLLTMGRYRFADDSPKKPGPQALQEQFVWSRRTSVILQSALTIGATSPTNWYPARRAGGSDGMLSRVSGAVTPLPVFG